MTAHLPVATRISTHQPADTTTFRYLWHYRYAATRRYRRITGSPQGDTAGTRNYRHNCGLRQPKTRSNRKTRPQLGVTATHVAQQPRVTGTSAGCGAFRDAPDLPQVGPVHRHRRPHQPPQATPARHLRPYSTLTRYSAPTCPAIAVTVALPRPTAVTMPLWSTFTTLGLVLPHTMPSR